jgi:hypothetical protein
VLWIAIARLRADSAPMKTSLPILASLLLLSACATPSAPAPSAADQFLASLQTLCGKSFDGALVTQNAADADFAGKRLVARSVGCGAGEVRIAFDVGENRTRTWIITRTESGLRLKHQHLHEDGTPDAVTMYGGDTLSEGTPTRQEFPVDAESKEMFTREGRTVSNTNVWALDVKPGALLQYELSRPGRLFQVQFDLSKPSASGG